MTRWYKGYRCKGDPERIRDVIVKQVHENDLARFVPSVKPEKIKKKRTQNASRNSVSSRRKQSCIEFYLFIAIESDEIGQIPSIVSSSLIQFLKQREQEYRGRLYQLIQWEIPEGFIYEEIKGMAEADFDVYNFTQSIPYQPQHKEQLDDNPFERLDTDDESSGIERIATNSISYEKLLYLLSTLGQGTWDLFKKVCQALNLENPGAIRRRFKLLGHLEVSSNGRYWSIAPTALVKVRSDSGNQEFILCGQQNRNLLQELEKNFVDLKEEKQVNAPRCVRLVLPETKDVCSIIDKVTNENGLVITNAGNAAITLADILPDLEQWHENLPNLEGVRPYAYSLKRFDGKEFVECAFSDETGMYELWPLEEKQFFRGVQLNRPIQTLFYHADTNTWRQGDWYGLRFLALYYSDQKNVAYYDSASSRLAVPYSQRFPELYERALVLASGLLPSYQETEQNRWWIYENVEQQLAEKLTQKLHITLAERID